MMAVEVVRHQGEVEDVWRDEHAASPFWTRAHSMPAAYRLTGAGALGILDDRVAAYDPQRPPRHHTPA